MGRQKYRPPMDVPNLTAEAKDAFYEERAAVLASTWGNMSRGEAELAPLQLVKKLTRFHGVFASNSRLRARVVPVPPPTTPHPPTPPLRPPPPTSPRGRLPWGELLRRTFGLDLLTCHACGSARRVLAFISNLPTARRILHHLNLPSTPPPLPAAAGPPQLTLFPRVRMKTSASHNARASVCSEHRIGALWPPRDFPPADSSLSNRPLSTARYSPLRTRPAAICHIDCDGVVKGRHAHEKQSGSADGSAGRQRDSAQGDSPRWRRANTAPPR